MTLFNVLNSKTQDSLTFFQSDLFKSVQELSVFSDGKTFADAIPKLPFSDIYQEYARRKKDEVNFDLVAFVDEFFELPTDEEVLVNGNKVCINEHIATLWERLEKPADKVTDGSLLPLKGAYVVPGGRFREIYYWDSYFTALGLLESNRLGVVESMLNNFLDLQARYGCIPNGNRSYYLSRSQPPIMGLMVELILPFKTEKKQFLAHCIKGIETEYQFWMRGQSLLSDDEPEQMRVVKMPDGSFLNRFWDENCSPRPESYREDIELLHESNPDNAAEFYRNIRAACESGWDFSSRWLADANDLASIETTRILPIDLNCLLYKQEVLLSQYYKLLGDVESSVTYSNYATMRKNAINRYMWSTQDGFFMDYHLDKKTSGSVKSLAGVLPLFVELANADQASQVASVIANEFLQKGGLTTTCMTTTQQWDAPNGWAPLHWFAVEGLLSYEHKQLAQTIRTRWLNTIDIYFEQTGKLMEKYNVCQQHDTAKGGEYDVQEGFGWTNGVYQAFTVKK
jgi:alpha,alpha-trehalase